MRIDKSADLCDNTAHCNSYIPSGEPIKIAASRAPKFKAGKALNARVRELEKKLSKIQEMSK